MRAMSLIGGIVLGGWMDWMDWMDWTRGNFQSSNRDPAKLRLQI